MKLTYVWGNAYDFVICDEGKETLKTYILDTHTEDPEEARKILEGMENFEVSDGWDEVEDIVESQEDTILAEIEK